MATVLLSWELGSGLGHLMRLLPLARGLCQRGHRVVAALRDLSRAGNVFGGLNVVCLQAPIKTHVGAGRFDPPRTFAHILWNSGFGEFDELLTMTAAWRSLYGYVRPHLIVFDHAPTALLAARGFPARKALVGNGFFCPPDVCPLPDLRPWLPDDSVRLRENERQVLDNANRVLAAQGQPCLARLSQLYREVDESYLATFQELDTYPERSAAHYWGAWPNLDGKPPVWPDGRGKRVFAYLRPFAALPRLLSQLNASRCPTLMYGDGLDRSVPARFRSATLRLENERLALAEVGKQCDLAILNGTHGTTISMLLAGKPILQLPICLEHAHNSLRTSHLGAALCANLTKPRQIEEALDILLRSTEHEEAARRFAARYAHFWPEEQINGMACSIARLLN